MKFHESLAATLIAAAATGLFILAYRHPRAYGKLADAVYIVVMIAMLIWMGYLFGYGDGAESAVEYAQTGGIIADFDTSPFGFAITGVLSGIIIVITILRYVHKLKDD